MAFDLLPTLHPKSKHWVICVRVSRKWEYRGGTDDGPILHVDLVLADEKGNAIYAEIPNSEVDTKSTLIQEGGTYIISRFRVSKAKSLYRPVDGPYMIELTCFTKITPAKEVTETFPAYIYKLTTISDLRSHADVLGIITAVSDTRLVQLPNQTKPTLNRDVMLKDLSSAEIKLTLWGQRATEFNIDEVYNEEETTPIIVLIVGTLMKTYRGRWMPLYCDYQSLGPNESLVVSIMYRLCFIANDGTAEAEMIAFGEVGRRIVGKPVQQLLRTARFASDTPPDIAGIRHYHCG
ncbi:replication factor A protein 1-like [Phragmites australis]|uniref:replication factor A protein 1-like n=1 Tax=Phragmites australis TaxID=29695 RepID=UPI002D78E47D|nr:replication factor A protein 1-like [Phragmites australis]